MSTTSDNVIPIRPEIRPSDREFLKEFPLSAASLLRVGVLAFGENGYGIDDDDILQVIIVAKERVEAFLDGVANMPVSASVRIDPSSSYDALDILTLLEETLLSKVHPRNRRTISPIRGAMKAVAELLERQIEVEQPEPSGPDDGESKAKPSAAGAPRNGSHHLGIVVDTRAVRT
jgi:hypothetical protein